MCGIAGFVDFNKKLDKKELSVMTHTLAHRGPDYAGFYFNELKSANLGFGHRRLSIIELTSMGHQPMTFEQLVITYNGEIYNFREIRTKLEKYGYTFVSHSDTEVILKAFHLWGVSAVDQFVGMFAIAIFDNSENKLYLIRDRAGVKPLYFYSKEGLFAFASEIKALVSIPQICKDINTDSVGSLLTFGYIPAPYSIFENIEKLRPGYIFELDIKTNASRNYCYWDILDYYNKPKLKISVGEAIEETERLLIQSCKLRLVSDVPLGIFLSGGYDSSLVTAIIQNENLTDRLKTFSIGFQEEEFNEAHHAREVALFLGTDHTEFIVNYKDVRDELANYPSIYDEPFNDTSGLLVSIISKLAISEIKVVLTGDGAEEVFAGYPEYIPSNRKLNFFASLPRPLMQSVGNIMKYSLNHREKMSSRVFPKLLMLNTLTGSPMSKGNEPVYFHDDFIDESFRIRRNSFFDINTINSFNSIYDKLLATDFRTRLPDDFLTKVDRATMYYGLEAREPLLDHRIIQFMAQLSCSIKCHNNKTKFIIKEITHEYLPEKLMIRPKMGFALPLEKWFKEDLNEMFTDILGESELKKSGFFNIKAVINQRDKFLTDRVNFYESKRLISVFLFQLWYSKWMT